MIWICRKVNGKGWGKIILRHNKRLAYGSSPELQEGSATVIMAGLSFVIMACLGVLVFLVQTYASKQQVNNVAELSALAAADAARGLTQSRPCDAAGKVVSGHGMSLEYCEIMGDLLDVALVRVKYAPKVWFEIRGSAKAGSPRYQQDSG